MPRDGGSPSMETAFGVPSRIASKLLCAALVAFATAFSACAQETITARADAWAPFNGDPLSDSPGYGIEILKEIFEPRGFKIDYQILPWDETLKEVEEGKYDIAIAANVEESPKLVFPKEEFGVNENAFFVKAGSSWTFAGIDSLRGVRLGCIDKYSYDSELDKYIASAKGSDKVQVLTGDEPLRKNIKKLFAERVDVLVECPQVMAWSLRIMGINEKEVSQAGKLKGVHKIYMAFTPAKESSKRYAKIFDEGMKELRENGKLKDLLGKYGLRDWR